MQRGGRRRWRRGRRGAVQYVITYQQNHIHYTNCYNGPGGRGAEKGATVRGAALLTFVRLIDSRIHGVCHRSSLGDSPGSEFVELIIWRWGLRTPKPPPAPTFIIIIITTVVVVSAGRHKLNTCIATHYPDCPA